MADDLAQGAESAPTRCALVQLIRDCGQWPAPHACEVPESEVSNYACNGWRVAPDEPNQPAPLVSAPLPVDTAASAEPRKRGRPRKAAK